jgi:hypothetical protein
MKKKGVLQLASTHCIDTLGVLTDKLHEVVELQLIVYDDAIQLQLCKNN